MENTLNNFELDFKESKIKVQKHSLAGQVIFRIQFSDNRSPLAITRAMHANMNRFWTSIPEGRQREAEEVGLLISEYFKAIQ